MLKCNPSLFRQHVAGAYRTDWHYRSTHLLKDILEAGDDYWLPVVNLMRTGDEIIVESDQMSWRYWLSVRMASMSPVPRVSVQMLNPLDINNGVQIFSMEAEDEKEEALEVEKARVEQQARHRQETETRLVDENHKPSVKWRGPNHKWTIMAYDRPAKHGFESQEEAQSAIDNGDADAEIAVNLDVFIKENEKKAA